MDSAWLSICNRIGFLTALDKPSKMHDLKADFIFLPTSNNYMAEDYHVHSHAATNDGRGSSFLELEDNYDEDVVEYFKQKDYSRPNQTTFKCPAN